MKMTCGTIVYYENSGMEIICYKDCLQSYPMHTHANHVTIGHVTEGEVCICHGGCRCAYHAGDYFCIMPDVPHAIEPSGSTAYSMLSVCITADDAFDKSDDIKGGSNRLKYMILNTPERPFAIRDMARSVGISPYHMIRQFKASFGLTPHQFQIQCRIRKAQKLLERGESVIGAAYAAGFCDQSHLDRCFRKIVGMTPNEYKSSIKRLA